jgi:hypothetical protein
VSAKRLDSGVLEYRVADACQKLLVRFGENVFKV